MMVRPVMCHLIDLIVGKYLHGVHRSDIVLDLQYIKENDLINTESSLNTYAFFSSLGEPVICEFLKMIHSNKRPTNLRNVLEKNKPFPLSTEGMLFIVSNQSDVMSMSDSRVTEVEAKGRAILAGDTEGKDGSAGEKLPKNGRGKSVSTRKKPSNTGKKPSNTRKRKRVNTEANANTSIPNSQGSAPTSDYR